MVKNVKEELKKLIDKSGVKIAWRETVTKKNSRNVPVTFPGDRIVTARVLFLKEPFSFFSGDEAVIADADNVKYILTYLEANFIKDDIIINSEGKQWRCEVPDIVEVDNAVICKHIAIEKIEGKAEIDKNLFKEKEEDDNNEKSDKSKSKNKSKKTDEEKEDDEVDEESSKS